MNRSLVFLSLLALLSAPAVRAHDDEDDDGRDYGRESRGWNDDDGDGRRGYDGDGRGGYDGDFRSDSSLAEGGEWLDTPEYGVVWRPTTVGSDWRPYSAGRWAFTDAGWAWVSDEPFGWAVYHYGRWAYAGDAGWIWLPGRVWAPAWVAWRWGDGYAGWCPLGPRDVAYEEPRVWVFVEQRNFLNPVQHSTVPYYEQEQRFSALPILAPRAAPVAHAVERATGRGIRPMPIAEASTPRGAGQSGGQVVFYRPRIARGPDSAGGGPGGSPRASGSQGWPRTGPAPRGEGARGDGSRGDPRQDSSGGSGWPRASTGQGWPRTGPAPRGEGARSGNGARGDPRPENGGGRGDNARQDNGGRGVSPRGDNGVRNDTGPHASPAPRPSSGGESHAGPRPPIYFGGVPAQGIVDRNARAVPPPPHPSDSKK